MLERAQIRAANLKLDVDLRLADVQALEFPGASFDTAVATFVFCSVPDPVFGLHELARVVKPGGQVLLLEHMRSANQVIGALMDLLNSFVVRMMGANINRQTVGNVEMSGLIIERVEDVGMGGIFKLIVARTATYPPWSSVHQALSNICPIFTDSSHGFCKIGDMRYLGGIKVKSTIGWILAIVFGLLLLLFLPGLWMMGWFWMGDYGGMMSGPGMMGGYSNMRQEN